MIILLAFLWCVKKYHESKNLKKRILNGETGMRVKYWDGKGNDHRGHVKKCEGYLVHIKEFGTKHIDIIHIDNVELPILA